MRTVPNWLIQVSWWVSGIFATGAFWYFLSQNSRFNTIISALGALTFAGISILLHRMQDSNPSNLTDPKLDSNPAEEFTRRYKDEPSHIRFVKSLPRLKAVIYEAAQEGWDSGISSEMKQASYDVIDFEEFAWLHLAEFYPPNHFGGMNPQSYIRNYIRDRFSFHWAKHEPNGPGTGGTIVGVLAGGDVIGDLEGMIADTVGALLADQPNFDFQAWQDQWQQTTLAPPIQSMSNQATPEDACLEFLRLENLQMPYRPMKALFDRARIMTDGAGVNIGWDVLTVTSHEIGSVEAKLREFAQETNTIRRENRLGQHYLALVALGNSAGIGESMAKTLADLCSKNSPPLGIRVLIGYMAGNRFVDLVMTSA